MGNPLAAAGVISDTIINPVLQHLTNVKNRKFAREMYNRQRQDALSDWEMQNAYNSPIEQMKRFKDAGLNPHLIYGQTNEGATVRSSSAPSAGGSAPQTDASGGLMKMYNIQQTQLQSDNLREVNENLKWDRLLKQLNADLTIEKADLTAVQKEKLKFDLGLATDLRDTTIAGKKAGVEKTIADTKFTLDENIRKEAMQKGNLTLQEFHIKKAALDIVAQRLSNAKTAEEINEIKHKIMLMKKEGLIRDWEIHLNSKGIRPGDPLWQRELKGLIDDIGKRNLPRGYGEKFETHRVVGGERRVPTYRATDSN